MFWREDSCFLFGQQNIAFKNSVNSKVTGAEAIWLPSSIISSIIFPAYQLSSGLYTNKKMSLMCEFLIFALHLALRHLRPAGATAFGSEFGACGSQWLWKLSVPSSAPVVTKGCKSWGEERGDAPPMRVSMTTLVHALSSRTTRSTMSISDSNHFYLVTFFE